jgi:hypothetical protein
MTDPVCSICRAASSAVCGLCHAVWYCSSKHQTADWPRHKLTCTGRRTAQRDAARRAAVELLTANDVPEALKRAQEAAKLTQSLVAADDVQLVDDLLLLARVYQRFPLEEVVRRHLGQCVGIVQSNATLAPDDRGAMMELLAARFGDIGDTAQAQVLQAAANSGDAMRDMKLLVTPGRRPTHNGGTGHRLASASRTTRGPLASTSAAVSSPQPRSLTAIPMAPLESAAPFPNPLVWSVDDVCDWLTSIGLSRNRSHFVGSAVRGDDLHTLLRVSSEDAAVILHRELRVTSETDRVFLLRGFRLAMERAGMCECLSLRRVIAASVLVSSLLRSRVSASCPRVLVWLSRVSLRRAEGERARGAIVTVSESTVSNSDAGVLPCGSPQSRWHRSVDAADTRRRDAQRCRR